MTMETTRICAGCSTRFKPQRTSQMFCTKACGKTFYNLQTMRGTVIAPLLSVAREAGRYKGGPSKALGAYARREADALISQWVIEDRAAGRQPALIVASKCARAWRAVDAMQSQWRDPSLDQ